MGARPNWTYIRVDVLMPTNPKVCGLGLASRWLLIELWCYCGQHLTDGYVPAQVWRRTGRARDRQALVDNGFASKTDGGYLMHDYLEHQRSRAEVDDLREKRRKAGERGGHARANAKQVLEQESQHLSSKSPSKHLAESEAEADIKGSVGIQSADRNGHRPSIEKIIISEVASATGRTITPEWALKVRDHILDGRQPSDPTAYIRQAIRNEANPRLRFLEQG